MNTAALIHSACHMAELENTPPVNVNKARTHKEVFAGLLDKLSVHYGADMHKLVIIK